MYTLVFLTLVIKLAVCLQCDYDMWKPKTTCKFQKPNIYIGYPSLVFVNIEAMLLQGVFLIIPCQVRAIFGKNNSQLRVLCVFIYCYQSIFIQVCFSTCFLKGSAAIEIKDGLWFLGSSLTGSGHILFKLKSWTDL